MRLTLQFHEASQFDLMIVFSSNQQQCNHAIGKKLSTAAFPWQVFLFPLFFFPKEKSWKTLSLFNVPIGTEKFFKKCKEEIFFPAAEAEIRESLCYTSSDAIAGKTNRNRKSLHVLDVSWMKR